MLWSSAPGANGNGRSLVELQSDELPVELAQHLLAGKPVLIDAAAKLGCVCSGGGAGIEPAESRERVIAVEPPRAASPVVDETVPVELELPLPASPRSAIDIVAPPSSALYAPTSPQPPLADEHVVEEARRAEDEVDAWWRPPSRLPESGSSTQGQLPRRHSPTRGIARPASGTLPTARDASGRQLPRTYVARRRSPGRTGRALSVDAPVESADKSDVQPVTPPRDRSARPDNFGSPSERTLEPRSTASAGVELSEPSTAPRTVPPTRTETELHEESRFQERAVKLPVTPLSDAPPREEATKPTRTLGDRPLAQLLTFALLISAIVLVSAAVGVVVGRWMAQR
jgi:hypothetical protein